MSAIKEQITVERVAAVGSWLAGILTVWLNEDLNLGIPPAVVNALVLSALGAGLGFLGLRASYNKTDQGQADEIARKRRKKR